MGEGSFQARDRSEESVCLGEGCCGHPEESLGSRAAGSEEWECPGCGWREWRLFPVKIGDICVDCKVHNVLTKLQWRYSDL